ncbi:MAG: flagellar protein FliS [Actinomycetota bacterium]|jgi:flagellar protein FliS|nr:flagellar protein FliS [Actinomycetota bacterium]
MTSPGVYTAEQRAALVRCYVANQVETASPAQRLMMLFTRLRTDLEAASAAFSVADVEAIHNSLVHAQRIVLVLRDSLSGSDWSGAGPLRTVYTFVHQRLVDCNLRKDPALLPVCVDLIARIHDANAQVLAEMATQAADHAGEQPGEPALSSGVCVEA